MTVTSQVDARARSLSGTGSARATRRQGFVPGIIYGGGKSSRMCAIDAKFLQNELHQHGFFTKIFSMNLEGAVEQVMVKDVQFHPVTDNLLHVDFIRVSKDTRVTVAVPLNFINHDKAPGLKRGGVLTVIVRSLEVHAPAHAIPSSFSIDLSGLDIHDSIHIDAIHFSQGVTAAYPERDSTLATISAPTAEKNASESSEPSE